MKDNKIFVEEKRGLNLQSHSKQFSIFRIFMFLERVTFQSLVLLQRRVMTNLGLHTKEETGLITEGKSIFQFCRQKNNLMVKVF